jgi:hypothetical protein
MVVERKETSKAGKSQIPAMKDPFVGGRKETPRGIRLRWVPPWIL